MYKMHEAAPSINTDGSRHFLCCSEWQIINNCRENANEKLLSSTKPKKEHRKLVIPLTGNFQGNKDDEEAANELLRGLPPTNNLISTTFIIEHMSISWFFLMFLVSLLLHRMQYIELYTQWQSYMVYVGRYPPIQFFENVLILSHPKFYRTI